MGSGIGTGWFLWSDYSGLFGKAERELSSLERRFDRDAMFNVLSSVTHVEDWIRNDPRFQSLPAQAKTDADSVRSDPVVTAVRELCNGAKHLNLPNRPAPSVEHRQRSWAERDISSVRRSLRVPLDEGETKYVVDVVGQAWDAIDACRDALANWRAFLAVYGLPVPP